MEAEWSHRGPISREQFVTDRETPGSHLVTSIDVTHLSIDVTLKSKDTPHPCHLTSLATAVTRICELEQQLRNT